jgi:DNA-binding helix-hairpin-helix protein with protein kinase domain
MNALPRLVQTSRGRAFHLTTQIGKGGEGAVYEANEAGDLAFKLYWPDKAPKRHAKVTAMAAAEWYKTNPFVAFPIDVLFANGTFVGFVMKKVGGHKPVHLLFSPASRKQEFGRINFRFLVRSASNIARAAASVHATGCVIGDVNESGFLVSDKATSVLIDSDSFQVATAQTRFLCEVGKLEYTPPELHGASLDKTPRTANHDNFGLAVLIFQLLFMGKHPFAGRYSGREDMPIAKAITEYRFAYSSQQAVTKMQPPPGAPLLSDFPTYLAQAFERSFGKIGPGGRTSSVEWVSILQNLEGELLQCNADNNHHHVRGKPCPWCRMEQNSPGFIAFGATQRAVFIPTQINANQFYAILNSIPAPAAWANFPTILVAPANLVAAPAAKDLLEKLKNRSLAGIGASAVGAVLVCYGGGAILPGLCILGLGFAANAIAPTELASLRQARSQAESSLNSVRDIWNKEAQDNKFAATKSEINEKLRQLSDLPNEEKREIQALEQRKRELQLNRHLDKFLIKKAQINKIGSARKTTLASYNIETAADIDRYKIESIPGFGPGLAAELLAWQRSIAAKFVFNPNEPTNPIDLAALKSKISAKKTAIEKFLRDNLTALQNKGAQVIDLQKKLTAAANRAYEGVKQAELNESAANGSLQKASKLISFCCAGFAGFGLLLGLGKNPATSYPNPNPVVSSRVSTRPVNTPPPRPQSQPPRVDTNKPAVRLPPQTPPVARPPATQPVPQSDQVARLPRIPWEPFVTPQTREQPAQEPARSPDTGLVKPPAQPESAPPLPPPQDIADVSNGSTPPPTAEPLLDTGAAADAMRIQERLIDLGFLAGPADGKWGPKSKQALREFRESRQLGTDTTWDEKTQSSLLAAREASAASPTILSPNMSVAIAPTFLGGWTATQGECGDPSDPPPMTISAGGASSFGGYCQFNSVTQEAAGIWRVAARCTVNGQPSYSTNVRLTLTPAGLKWTSPKGEQLYYRCAQRSQ